MFLLNPTTTFRAIWHCLYRVPVVCSPAVLLRVEIRERLHTNPAHHVKRKYIVTFSAKHGVLRLKPHSLKIIAADE